MGEGGGLIVFWLDFGLVGLSLSLELEILCCVLKIILVGVFCGVGNFYGCLNFGLMKWIKFLVIVFSGF